MEVEKEKVKTISMYFKFNSSKLLFILGILLLEILFFGGSDIVGV